ncbi:MAG TPA: hypothetical protein VIO58_08445 [Candidatus Methanoperedens sp.]
MTTWYDLIPVFGIIVTIVGVSLKVGRVLQKLDNVIDDVREIKAEIKKYGERIAILESKMLK